MSYRRWHVFLNGVCIDSVFFKANCDQDYVLRGLIEHDGYDSGITIEEDLVGI